jgi:membrane associated rhomboid family serine protease
MSTAINDEQSPIGLTPVVQWMLVANIAVFFLQQTIVRASDLAALFAFHPDTLRQHWWTPITYAFLHGDLWHIAFNMFALWQFGPRVERLFGSSRFLRLYVLSALGGAAAMYAFDRGTPMIGASAAVYGVMYAFAHAWPRTVLWFFGVIPMQVRFYILAFVVMSLGLHTLGGNDGVAHLAHLGGVATAWFLVRLPTARRLGSWQDRFSPAPEPPEDETLRAFPRTAVRPQRAHDATDPIDDVVARSNALVQRRPPVIAPQRPEPVPVVDVPEPSARDEMNALLDKMSLVGGQSGLTTREQVRLRELSDLLRGDAARG